MKPARKKYRKINAFTQGVLIKLMLEGELSCQELAEETGLHYVTVCEYTRELHRAGACYICEWRKDGLGRDCVKIYRIGVGKDATREKKTATERQRKYRKTKRHLEMLRATAGACENVENIASGNQPSNGA